MINQKKRDLYGPTLRLLTLLVTGLLAFSLMPLAAADVSVTRDLPDEPIYPGTQITVTLNQTGFYLTGVVWEILPDGFTFRGLAPHSGGEYRDYDQMTNNLTIGFEDETTVQYLVETGTAEQIEAAVFSGTWTTLSIPSGKISGEVEGDTTLTLATEPTPSPTPSPSNNGGGGGGNGGGGGATPTSTTSPTPTTSISPSPSASPGVSPTPSSGPTASPGATTTPASPTPTAGSTTSPSASPTAKPGIPGFELIFALAGLLAVAQWLWRRRS
jgi:hypothetical protein